MVTGANPVGVFKFDPTAVLGLLSLSSSTVGKGIVPESGLGSLIVDESGAVGLGAAELEV